MSRAPEVHLTAGSPEPRYTPSRDDTFGILVIGDFAGRGAQGSLANRPALPVDRDDLDSALRHLGTSVPLPAVDGGNPVRMSIHSMEGFDPDRLLASVPLLRRLHEERERIGTRGNDPAPEPEGGILDRVLSASGEEAEVGSALDAFIERAVAPYRIEGPDPELEEARAALDRERATQLRRILADPAFRALEARWRGLELLCRRLDTGPRLKIQVLQAAPSELARAAVEGTLATVLSRTAESALDGAPWSLCLVDHAFGGSAAELAALQGLARLGAATGTTFLAEGDPTLLALEGEAARSWAALRASAGGGHIGLLLPRFLLREPWDPEENPVHLMRFREFDDGVPEPRELLWGHPGILAAILLGDAFARDGWEMRPDRLRTVERLPIALHRTESETVALPATELPLNPDLVHELSAAGFIPVVGRPGEGRVDLVGLRSIAGEPLKGRWDA